MALRAASALLFAAGAASHGVMTLPVSRQGGTLERACHMPEILAATWFTDSTWMKGKPTNCAKEFLNCKPPDKDRRPAGCGVPGNDDRGQPWYAPGTADVLSPCGTICPQEEKFGPGCTAASLFTCGCKLDGSSGNMTDGIDLPKTKRTLWQAGSTVRVAWADEVNHGGGYAYRLCPAGEAQTESCFQRNHLEFVGDTSAVHWTDGTEVAIPAVTLSVGTVPAGSQWRRNPIPTGQCGGSYIPAPCPGCGEGFHNNFSVVDRVAVPVDITPGDYTLSWRWDCEVTPQVWASCADVTVVAGSATTPAPALTPAPVPTQQPPAPSPVLTPAPQPAPGSPAFCCWWPQGGDKATTCQTCTSKVTDAPRGNCGGAGTWCDGGA